MALLCPPPRRRCCGTSRRADSCCIRGWSPSNGSFPRLVLGGAAGCCGLAPVRAQGKGDADLDCSLMHAADQHGALAERCGQGRTGGSARRRTTPWRRSSVTAVEMRRGTGKSRTTRRPR